MAGATSYRLDVSTSGTFSTYVGAYNNFSVAGTNQVVSGLSPGTTYYFRVRTVNSSGSVSDNSNTIAALTLPADPVVSAASNVTSRTFDVTWSSVMSATSYQFDVSRNANFDTFEGPYNNFSVDDTSLHVVNLTPNTTYYFRVRAINASGASAYSNTESQLTATAPPTAISPTSLTSNAFTANWVAVPGATSYRLDVSTSSTFSTMLPGFDNLSVTGTSKVVTPLTIKEAIYYYRVSAVNASSYPSPYSNIVGVQLDQNYIKTTTANSSGMLTKLQLESASLAHKSVTYTFYDGLGRPNQTVSMQASPSQKDIIQPFVYNEYGLEAVKYLPYTGGNDGWYKPDFLTRENSGYNTAASPQYQFYQLTPKVATDTRPYAETFFEHSPLHRPEKDFGPGADWFINSKHITHNYLINQHGTASSSTHEKIIAWIINESGMPVRAVPLSGYIVPGGYYATGQLQIRSTKDEHCNEVREYTNKLGQVILKKVQATTAGANNLNDLTGTSPGWALTYYIYDNLGNLRYVFPPELSKHIHAQTDEYVVTTGDLDTWAFQYKFDSRRRMIMNEIATIKSDS